MLVLGQWKDVTEIRDANGNLVGVYTPKGKTDAELIKLFDLDKARARYEREKDQARPFREIIEKLQKGEVKQG
jgi:hypothetical protein